MRRGIALEEGELGRALEEALEAKQVPNAMMANAIRKKEKEKVALLVSKEEEGGRDWFRILRGDQVLKEEKIRELTSD